MEKGFSSATNFLLQYIEKEKEEIDRYVNSSLQNTYYDFQSEEEIKKMLSSSMMEFLDHLSIEEKQDMRDYTGYQFRNINAVFTK